MACRATSRKPTPLADFKTARPGGSSHGQTFGSLSGVRFVAVDATRHSPPPTAPPAPTISPLSHCVVCAVGVDEGAPFAPHPPLATTSANNVPGFFTVAHYGYSRQVVVSTPAPRLQIRSGPTNVFLSWLIAPGYRLESTDRLGAPGTWMQVTNPISVANGSNSVGFDPRGTAGAFFRLTRP